MIPHEQILVVLDAAVRYAMLLAYAAVLWFTCMAIAHGIMWAWNALKELTRP